MLLIIITTIIIYLIVLAWTWHNLSGIEHGKKIIYTIVGLIIMYIVTTITFNISKTGIVYEDPQMEIDIGNILILIFAGLNSLIVLPYLSKLLSRINDEDIEKNQVSKRIIVIIVVIVLCLMMESGYLKDIQNGILNVYETQKNIENTIKPQF